MLAQGNRMLASQTKPKIGPHDHGRKMSLRAFEFADVEEGYLIELARGYIVVSEVASYFHAMQVALIRNFLVAYQLRAPGVIHAILEGSSSKLLIPAWESERHPDIAVYLSPPKGKKDRTMWRRWIPDIAIEVVSPSSDTRDYTEKRDEYWTLGVKEYWIVGAKRQQVVHLRRGRSDWLDRSFGPADKVQSKLLPGFELPCQPIFDLAGDDELE
jgi:Uma2 family endonuclease